MGSATIGAAGREARRGDDVGSDANNLHRVAITKQVPPDAILPAEILAGEGPVYDRNKLAGRCIARGQKSACAERYLQSLEVRRRHIDQVGHILLSRLRAIGYPYGVVQCAFVGNAESHGSGVHSGNVFDRRCALIQQFQKRSPIVVAGVVQRCFCDHHIFRIESRRQCSQVDECPYQQTRDGEENDGQCHFSDDQRVARARAACLRDGSAAATRQRSMHIHAARTESRQETEE